MDVNNQNYEEYILDFLEGNLNSELHSKVETFLSENPVIQEEVKDLEKYVLPVEDVFYQNKANLYKPERKLPIFNLFTAGIAASLALILGFTFFLRQQNSQSDSTAENKPVIEQQQTPVADKQPDIKVDPENDSNVENKKVVMPFSKKSKPQMAQPPQASVQKDIEYKESTVNTEEAYTQPIDEQENQPTQPMVIKPVENNTFIAAVTDEEVNEKPQVNEVEQVIPQKGLQATLTEPTQEKEQPKSGQGLIDSIVGDIEFAENDERNTPSQQKKASNGFEIETLKSDKDTYVTSTLVHDSLNQKPARTALENKEEPSILDIILKTDKKEIKRAILPKSFKIGKDKKKEPKKIDINAGKKKTIEIKPINQKKTDDKKK